MVTIDTSTLRANEAVVPANVEAMRLDKGLLFLFPGLGLRQRQRLFSLGRVLVNGRLGRKGDRITGGDRIAFVPIESGCNRDGLLDRVRLVKQSERFAAFFKPGGVHTEAQALKKGGSLEEELDRVLDCRRAYLLNRLDLPTSGLVLAAFTQADVVAYKAMQNRGDVKKTYLAVVQGWLHESVEVKSKIDDTRRSRVKVLQEQDSDRTRWSHVTPLHVVNNNSTTLVRVLIFRGRRHQIRAHLASLGHPILGDVPYGGQEADTLHLHHQKVHMPVFEADVDPEWPKDALGMSTVNRGEPLQNLPR